MSSSNHSEQNTADPKQNQTRQRRERRRERRWLKDINSVAAIVGSIATVLGLILAVIHFDPFGSRPGVSSGHSPTATASVLSTTPSAITSSVPTNTPGGPVLPTSTPKPAPTATPTLGPDCFKNVNGSDGHGYLRAHISDYAALLNNDPNEIATDQAYIKTQLDIAGCSNHQASTARVYGSYPSGGDQSTAMAVANKVISPTLQNLGTAQFIFINTTYNATVENDPYGSYNFPNIEIVWRF
jgi:hypothetical protein